MSFGIPVRNALSIGIDSAVVLTSGLKILNSAIARFDDTSIVGTNPVIEWQNRNYGGAGFDLDTPVGTDANLSTLDSGVALLPGGSGAFFSTPDSVANSIVGSLTLIAYLVKFDWTNAETIMSKWLAAGDQRAWFFGTSATGQLTLQITDDRADGGTSVASGAVTGFSDGAGGWVRVTVDISNGDTDFFTSTNSADTDPTAVSWTANGSQQDLSAETSIADTTAGIDISGISVGAGQLLAGKVTRAVMISGTDPTVTPVVNMNASEADPGVAIDTDTWTSSTGEEWTVNGDAFINNTGYTGILSRGSVVLETSAGQTVSSPLTIYDVFKPTLAAPGADQVIFDARSDAGESISLRSDESNSDKYTLNQGSDIAISQAYDNTLQVFTSQLLGTASTKLTVAAGSITGDAGSEDLDFGTIFGALGGGSTTPGLYLARLVFAGAHNAGEILRIQTLLTAKYLL